LQGKVRNRYSGETEEDADRDLRDWENEYDMEHGIMPDLPPPIDMTRPD
jgi:hypothetical protein